MSGAITVDGVSKRYRLYHERNQTLKATIMRGRRARFEEFWALRDVSFEVEQGETFGLIGENGSGKSTLLKCMANILRPDRGHISVNGKLSALLELGAGFHPELTGRENVYLNGAILGLSKQEINARFDEIVEFAGLHQFIDSPVKNYSSGMYVRLGFSVAINVDPDVLLFDEILAVGDAEFQQRCNEKFVELKDRGKTIVIVSHALDAIRNFCDQAVLLDHGEVRALGPTGQVVDDYMEGVHIERRETARGTRAGSSEIQIERVRLLDADGNPTHRVRTGDACTLRIEFTAAEPVERPIFGFGVQRIDGVGVSGFNTRERQVVPEKLDGQGHVDYHIESLPLLGGTYDVTATIYDRHQARQYDGVTRALRFDVQLSAPDQYLGVVTFGGDWTLTRGGPE